MVDPKYAPVDATKLPRFAYIATFLRTRRVELDSEMDIGLVGVPFDLGLNYRSGPRDAPAAVREASRLVRRVHPTGGIDPCALCNMADLGDAPVNPMDKDESIRRIETFFFSADDTAWGRQAGFTVITSDAYEEMGRAAAIDRIRQVVDTGPTYLTLDIDGLDPSDCPGTPVPEIGGSRPGTRRSSSARCRASILSAPTSARWPPATTRPA